MIVSTTPSIEGRSVAMYLLDDQRSGTAVKFP
jgi:hypothetical protein